MRREIADLQMRFAPALGLAGLVLLIPTLAAWAPAQSLTTAIGSVAGSGGATVASALAASSGYADR